jgi:3-oxoacyl-[acyl-carrier protein] reductase
MVLKGKVAFITGCNRGIGKAILEKFAENGATVYANARSVGCLDSISQELSEKYMTSIIPAYFDVTDKAAIRGCFVKILDEQNRLDILVNNAGIMKDALLGMIDYELMHDVFNTNVFSVINITQYAYKIMRRQKSGSIINIASIAGVEGSPGQAVYSASKGAVISLTKSLSKELGVHGIRVNAIAPGIIDTDLIKPLGPAKIEDNIKNVVLGRLGKPDEVADAALFLASDLSSYISGQVLVVDGKTII